MSRRDTNAPLNSILCILTSLGRSYLGKHVLRWMVHVVFVPYVVKRACKNEINLSLQQLSCNDFIFLYNVSEGHNTVSIANGFLDAPSTTDMALIASFGSEVEATRTILSPTFSLISKDSFAAAIAYARLHLFKKSLIIILCGHFWAATSSILASPGVE